MKTYYSMIAGLLSALGLATASAATITGTVDPVSGFLSTSAPIIKTYVASGTQRVPVAAGQSLYSAYLTVNGVSRRYLVLRPNPAPASAPLMIVMSPEKTTPEGTANLTMVTDYALTQGFWAVFPEAVGGQWKEDPSTTGSDDVQFVSALIDTLATQGVDPTRVYAAGFSNGGFMTERLACELSDKIAAFGIVGATMKGPLISRCKPAVQRPKQYFLGASDTVVPYAGIYSGTLLGLWGGVASAQWWTSQQGCAGVIASQLPDRSADGGRTNVTLSDYPVCALGKTVRLYTINNGGHAWPGSNINVVGNTTQDISAMGLIWSFAAPYRR